MPASPDHYAALGVPPSATHVQLQSAYRAIMRASHPDLTGADPVAAERAVAANAAWTVLRDPVRRASYDRQRASADAAGSADAGAVVSWGPGGVRPLTPQQLREAAARQPAYSSLRAERRAAFSAATLRVGLAVMLLGMVLLALVVTR